MAKTTKQALPTPPHRLAYWAMFDDAVSLASWTERQASDPSFPPFLDSHRTKIGEISDAFWRDASQPGQAGVLIQLRTRSAESIDTTDAQLIADAHQAVGLALDLTRKVGRPDGTSPTDKKMLNVLVAALAALRRV